MRIHYLQHVSFEGPGIIADYARANGHALTVTRLFGCEAFPALTDIDLLVIMGGPMNIYEEETFPWLVGEKIFIREVVDAGKPVLGICLGAQLLADVLGGRVYPGKYKEIGWFPVNLTGEGRQSGIGAFFPKDTAVFQWHGDTFSIPPGAVQLIESDGCSNQAFLYDERVLGLQFHLESTPDSIRALVEHCGDEIVEGKFIQTADEMLAPPMGCFCAINDAMFSILDYLLAKV